MTRIFSMATMIVLSTLAIAPASSQQLQQPVQHPITPATPPAQDAGVGPRLNAQPGQPPTVPASPSQRPPSSGPIPSEGPSKPAAKAAIKPVEPAERSAPTQVLDDRGRLVPGAVKVAPNRAYDPATGRYFQTMPTPRPR
jgi:hypothetical protein